MIETIDKIKKELIVTLFSEFLNNSINKDKLISSLREIESARKGKSNKNKRLWFRFFKTDTAATTISDLDLYLYCPVNSKYMIGCVELAVEKQDGLEINFS